MVIPPPVRRTYTFADDLRLTLSRGYCNAFAGSLAYSGLLAIVPFLIFTLAILGTFSATDMLLDLLHQAQPAMPNEMYDLLTREITRLTSRTHRDSFALGAAVSVVFAIWGTSSAFRTMMTAFDAMYESRGTRTWWQRYVESIILSLLVALLLIGAMVLMLVGDYTLRTALASSVHVDTIKTLWKYAQWPIIIAMVLLAVGILYSRLPARGVRRFRLITHGSVVATLAWLVFSWGFAQYVDRFGNYNTTYGALAGAVLALLYAYWSSYMLLFGAALDRVVAARRLARSEAEDIPAVR